MLLQQFISTVQKKRKMEKANKVNRFPFLIVQATLIVIALLLFEFDWSAIDFQLSCVIGTVLATLSLINILVFKKKIIDPIIVFYVAFILFQYGLPIIRAFNPSFYSFYLTLFTEENLIYCSNLTILCILFAGLSIVLIGGRQIGKPRSIVSDDRRKMIWLIFLFVALLTGAYSIYIQIRMIGYARIYGYNYVKTDTMGITNSLSRLTDALFVPSVIILLVYSKSKLQSIFAFALALLFAVLSIFGGGRTVALGIMLALGYFLYTRFLLKRFGKASILIAGLFIFLVAYAAVFVAALRQDYSTDFTFAKVIESVFDEMGFNFTSICFTRLYINSPGQFIDGQSYANLVLLFIPKSVDSTGFLETLFNNIPDTWLAAQLATTYGTFFEWGVGFSLIAEAYMNFGDYAYLAIFVISFLITWIVDRENIGNAKLFNEYVKTIMMSSLITLPRRSSYFIVKEIEYCIIIPVLIILAVVLLSHLFVSHETNESNIANEKRLA